MDLVVCVFVFHRFLLLLLCFRNRHRRCFNVSGFYYLVYFVAGCSLMEALGEWEEVVEAVEGEEC